MPKADPVRLTWREWLCGVLLGFAVTAQVWVAPTTRLFAAGDGMFFYWQGWRSAQNVREGKLPWLLDTVAYPGGNNLLAGDGIVHMVVSTIWNLLVVNPVLATNLTVLTAVVLNAMAANALARRIQPHRAVALLAMVAFVATPLLAARYIRHPNLMFAAPSLMFFAALVKGKETRPVWVFGVQLGAWLGLAFLSSMWWGLFAVLGAGVGLAARGVRRSELRSLLVGASWTAAVAVGMYLPVLIERFRLQRVEQATGSLAIVARNEEAASLYLTAVPHIYQPSTTSLLGQVVSIPERDWNASIGAVLLIGLVALVFVKTPWRRVLLPIAATLSVLALGTTIPVTRSSSLYRAGPFEVLLNVPGLGALRVPGRIGFTLACVGVAAFAVVLGHWWPKLSPRARVGISVGIVALSVLWYPVKIDRGEPLRPPEEVEALAAVANRGSESVGALLRVPHGCFELNRYTFDQMTHKQVEVGCHGFISSLPMASQLAQYSVDPGWRLLRCVDHSHERRDVGEVVAVEELSFTEQVSAVQSMQTTLGVRFIVFDRSAECNTAEHERRTLRLLDAAGDRVAEAGDLVVFELL